MGTDDVSVPVSLLIGGEMGAAIPRVAIFRGIGAKRTFFAVAGGLQLVNRNAKLHQGVAGCGGATVSERNVVLGGTTLVAVTFDGDDEIRVHAEDGLKSGRVSLEDGLIVWSDLALVVIEVEVLDLLGQNFSR